MGEQSVTVQSAFLWRFLENWLEAVGSKLASGVSPLVYWSNHLRASPLNIHTIEKGPGNKHRNLIVGGMGRYCLPLKFSGHLADV